MKNLIAIWNLWEYNPKVPVKKIEIYPIRNERRLSPSSLDIDEKDIKKWEYLGCHIVPELSSRYNSWIIRLYRNRKTKKEYGTVYQDGCFNPYNFTYRLI